MPSTSHILRPSLAAVVFAVWPHSVLAQGVPPVTVRPGIKKPADQKMPPEIAKAAKAFDAALKQQQAGHISEAKAGYLEVIRLAPNAFPAHMNLGLIYRSEGKLKEAEASLKRAAGLDPKNVLPVTQLAYCYLAQARYAEARVQASKAVVLDPKSGETHFALGASNAGLKSLVAAEKEYREACRLSPQKAQYFVSWATTLGALEKRTEALAAIDSAIKADPNSFQAHMYRGILLQTEKNFKGAIASYRRAAEIEPREAAPWYNMGISWQLQAKPSNAPGGDPATQEAITAYLKAIDFAPKYGPAYLNTARLYFHVGNYRQAARYFDQASAMAPDNIRLLADTATANAYASQMTQEPKEKAALRDHAEKLYRDGLQKSSEPALYSGLGGLYEQSTQVDKAAALYQEWTQKQPKVAAAWMALAKAKEMQKKPAEAQAAYEKAIAVDPKNTASRMSIAGMMENQNKLDLAVAQYQQVLASEPKNNDARRHLGQVYLRQEKKAEALAQFEEMKKIAPKDTAPYVAIASLYERDKKMDEAVREYHAMAAIDPKNPIARWYAARALEQQKKYDDAIAEYREIEKIDPKESFYVANVPRLLELAGKKEAALEEFKRLVARDPKNVQFRNMYAVSLEKQQHYGEAIREYEAILDQSTNATWVHTKIGNDYLAMKKWADARVAYGKALERPADAVDAFNKIESTFTQEGKPEGWFFYLRDWMNKHTGDRIALAKIETAAVNANKLPELLVFLRELYKSNATDGYFMLDYASFLNRHGFKDEAMAAYKTVTKLRAEDYSTRLTLGALYETAGRLPDAIATYEEITNIKSIPALQLAGFRVKLATLYEKNGQTNLALGQYKQALATDPNNAAAGAAVKRLGSLKAGG